MDVLVLHVADCPNVSVALERVAEAVRLTGRDDVRVSVQEVTSDAEAQRLGFAGSPTILVDGTDHFGPDGHQAGLACRFFSSEGDIEGAPPVASLASVMQP